MKDIFIKTMAMTASFMIFVLGVTATGLAMEDHIEEFRKDFGLTSEIYFNAKFSDYVTGTAAIINSGYSENADSSSDISDWSADNYTVKSPVSLRNFHVEFDKENLSGGFGFKTFPEREGLVSALQDIEYQFFPVDATSPLRLNRIGVPGLWGKYYFDSDNYIKLVGYETLWSKISPDVVPKFDKMKLDSPSGDQGYSFLTSFGTRLFDTAIEAGFTRGWSAWPSKEVEKNGEFSPNPYRLTAGYVKLRRNFGDWTLGTTALVKDANENAGTVYNILYSVDKKLSLWGKPASIGGSYFFVNSFEQSTHFRTSPWEDLGNSWSLRVAIDDEERKVRHAFEAVINHEEYGFYLTEITERSISNTVKVRTQIDFISDRQKYVSNEYDSIKIAGYFMITF